VSSVEFNCMGAWVVGLVSQRPGLGKLKLTPYKLSGHLRV